MDCPIGVAHHRSEFASFPSFFSVSLQLRDEHVLDPGPRPWSFAKKRQTGFDAGIVEKTANGNAARQLLPSMPLDKSGDDGFQRDAVQWIAGLRFSRHFRGPTTAARPGRCIRTFPQCHSTSMAT